MNEKDAIRRLRKQDLSGLTWIIDHYYEKAIYTAFLITNNVQIAEDVVQEMILTLGKTISSFDERRHFEPWFLKCIANSSIHAARDEYNQISIDDANRGISIVDHLVSEDMLIEDTIIQTELNEAVWCAIQNLSPRQRAAVVERYFLSMSEKEMSEDMLIAPGTVKWLLNSARKKLHTLLYQKRSDL